MFPRSPEPLACEFMAKFRAETEQRLSGAFHKVIVAIVVVWEGAEPAETLELAGMRKYLHK